MYQEISQLLMYGDLEEDSILAQMGEVFGKYETGEYNKTGLVRDINTQVKRILKVQWHRIACHCTGYVQLRQCISGSAVVAYFSDCIQRAYQGIKMCNG